MVKLLEGALKKLGAISILFFLFGALLILLGITKGVEISGLNQLVPDDNSRTVSLILGIVFVTISFVMYFIPTKENRPDFAAILKDLSPSQRRILDYLCDNGTHGNFVSQNQVFEKFQSYFSEKGYSESENYYRLEQLHLLGFLEKIKSGKENGRNIFSYKLSSTYEKAIEKSK